MSSKITADNYTRLGPRDWMATDNSRSFSFRVCTFNAAVFCTSKLLLHLYAGGRLCATLTPTPSAIAEQNYEKEFLSLHTLSRSDAFRKVM